MLEQIKKSEEATLTIPENWFKPKARVDREYLWNMLKTFHPDWAWEVTNHAHRQRFSATLGTEPDKVVQVCDEVAKILESMPYLPIKFIPAHNVCVGKRRRGLGLIRKIKVRKEAKERKTVPLKLTLD